MTEYTVEVTFTADDDMWVNTDLLKDAMKDYRWTGQGTSFIPPNPVRDITWTCSQHYIDDIEQIISSFKSKIPGLVLSFIPRKK